MTQTVTPRSLAVLLQPTATDGGGLGLRTALEAALAWHASLAAVTVSLDEAARGNAPR